MSQAVATPPVTPPAPPAAQQPAAYAELKAALMGADAAFICAQLEAAATLAQAQTAWMAEQNRRLEAANQQTAEAKKKADEAAAQATANKSGVEPLGSGKAPAGFEGDPIVAWNEALAAKLKVVNSRARAVCQLAAEQPELHQAYIRAYNAARNRG
jgi:hypothetical protein